MSDQEPRKRQYYLDHLRASLVILVVLHHLALVYGAVSPFYYQEPPFDQPTAFMALSSFVLLNQSWFMGALFLLAGYFTPGSIDRRGPGSFLMARSIRLGIPILVFIFVLGPISSIGFFLMPASLTGITQGPTWSTYPRLLGLGPMWFVAMLLIFDFGYAAWRVLAKGRPARSARRSSFPGYLTIAAFTVALALVSYLTRMVVPLGQYVHLFVEFLSFPTVAYLPQYLAFFVLGVVACRRDWLASLPDSTGAAGFAAAIVAAVLLFPLAISGHMFSVAFAEPARFVGNGHWQSAVYALWDSTTAVGLCLGFTVLFRRAFNGSGRFGRFLSQHSYTVYIIHSPIIVYLAFAMRGIDLPNLLKFGLAAVVVVPTCFAVAYIVRKMPLAAAVL
jgi:glucan biosynthesis protein C